MNQSERLENKMDQRIKNALKTDKTIDMITTGAKSGEVRRTEIWFHNLNGRIIICGTPSGDGSKGKQKRRDWLANLKKTPAFVFCLKESVHAELKAKAVEILDEEDRREIMSAPETKWYRDQGISIEDLVRYSPIVEIFFES